MTKSPSHPNGIITREQYQRLIALRRSKRQGSNKAPSSTGIFAGGDKQEELRRIQGLKVGPTPHELAERKALEALRDAPSALKDVRKACDDYAKKIVEINKRLSDGLSKVGQETARIRASMSSQELAEPIRTEKEAESWNKRTRDRLTKKHDIYYRRAALKDLAEQHRNGSKELLNELWGNLTGLKTHYSALFKQLDRLDDGPKLHEPFTDPSFPLRDVLQLRQLMDDIGIRGQIPRSHLTRTGQAMLEEAQAYRRGEVVASRAKLSDLLTARIKEYENLILGSLGQIEENKKALFNVVDDIGKARPTMLLAEEAAKRDSELYKKLKTKAARDRFKELKASRDQATRKFEYHNSKYKAALTDIRHAEETIEQAYRAIAELRNAMEAGKVPDLGIEIGMLDTILKRAEVEGADPAVLARSRETQISMLEAKYAAVFQRRPSKAELQRMEQEAEKTRRESPGAGVLETEFLTGQYKGLTFSEVPLDYLIWIATGGLIKKREMKFRTPSGTPLIAPLVFSHVEPAEFVKNAFLQPAVRAYLRSRQGRMRFEQLVEYAPPEIQSPEIKRLMLKALIIAGHAYREKDHVVPPMSIGGTDVKTTDTVLGTVIELESRSRRVAAGLLDQHFYDRVEHRIHEIRKHGLVDEEGKILSEEEVNGVVKRLQEQLVKRRNKLAKQVSESNRINLERTKYIKIRKETYEAERPFLDSRVSQKVRDKGGKDLSKLLEKNERLAVWRAEKAYQKELKNATYYVHGKLVHGLDDFSVLYRRYLGNGLDPEECKRRAQRDIKGKDWHLPAAFLEDRPTKSKTARDKDGNFITESEAESRESIGDRMFNEVSKVKQRWLAQGSLSPEQSARRREIFNDLLEAEKRHAAELRAGLQVPELEQLTSLLDATDPLVTNYHDLPSDLRRRFDEDWKSSDPKWYGLKRKRAIESWHDLAEKVDKARSRRDLEELGQEIVRLFYNIKGNGEIVQDIHPLVQWLENRWTVRWNSLTAETIKSVGEGNDLSQATLDDFRADIRRELPQATPEEVERELSIRVPQFQDFAAQELAEAEEYRGGVSNQPHLISIPHPELEDRPGETFSGLQPWDLEQARLRQDTVEEKVAHEDWSEELAIDARSRPSQRYPEDPLEYFDKGRTLANGPVYDSGRTLITETANEHENLTEPYYPIGKPRTEKDQ